MKNIEKFGVFKYKGCPAVALSARKIDEVDGIDVYKGSILLMNSGWHFTTWSNPNMPGHMIRNNWCYGQPDIVKGVIIASFTTTDEIEDNITYSNQVQGRAVGAVKRQMIRSMKEKMGV